MNRVFIVTDLEGTAGVTSFSEHAAAGALYLDRARRLATAEVNAAVEGLLAADVDDILILDGHGCEGLWYEDLHPAVRLLHGRPRPPGAADPIIDEYQALAIVGQHAMAGVATSNMNHTQSAEEIDYIKLNGRLIGEIAQMALYRGAAGMPLFFLSGELAACDEARALVPEVETVAVKQGLGRNSAISLSAVEAGRRIKDGIAAAVKKHRSNPIPPLRWEAPYALEKRYFHTDAADVAAAIAGAERIDAQTVLYRSDNLRSLIYR